MSEDVELDDALKREFLELEEKLGAADLFTLLGVEKEAEPKVVKAAFYRLARRLHPDRFFRRRLGSFKARIDTVFEALTRAHQTLVNPEKREAYLAATPAARKPPPPKPQPKRVRGQRIALSKNDLPDLSALTGKKK